MINGNKITINKTFELQHSIEVVKGNINRLLNDKAFKLKYTYMLQKNIDSLNYYRISKMNGVVAVSWDINLKVINDVSTNIELVCICDTSANSIATSTLDSFLERLVMLLEGKADDMVIGETKKGCLGLLMILSILGGLVGCGMIN
jgi:hypothetical protein